MLLFVIYAHFSKICRNYACAFNFKFSVEKYLNISRWITMQQTSKWQTHLPYLYLETLRVHNSFSEHCTEFTQETSTRTPSWEKKKPQYHLCGNQLKAVSEVKDLGIYITSNLSWSMQANKCANKANSVLGFIRRTVDLIPRHFLHLHMIFGP